MLYPFRFNPIFKPRIWGGRRLEELFAKPLPAGASIGESWELSGLPGDESIVTNGPLAGHKLTELVAQFGADLLGPACLLDGQFPLLIKLLDARENLSVQVHPNRRMVDRLGPPARLKSECWYVLDAAPGAVIWVGLVDDVDRAQFAAAVANGSVHRLLRVVPVRAGDFVYLPAGTVHALGGGVVVAEVQTPSDTTYRVFDWNRVDPATGTSRTLHVAEALEAIEFDGGEPGQAPGAPASDRVTTRLLACEHFVVDRRRLAAGADGAVGGAGRMVVWQILRGAGQIRSSGSSPPADLVAGEAVLLPAALSQCAIVCDNALELLEITIP